MRRTLDAYVAAFNAHDARKLADCYKPEAVVATTGPSGLAEHRGRDAIEKQHIGLFSSMPDIRMATERVLVQGDVAVQQWASVATYKPANDPNAVAKPVGIRGLTLFWIDTSDGQVRRDHTYYDAATLSVQMGMHKGRVRPPPTLPGGAGEWVMAGGPNEARNVETVKALWSAVERKDDKIWGDAYTEDVQLVNINEAEDRRGRKTAKEALGVLVRAFPDIKLTPQNAWGVGDFVVAEAVLGGTHKNALGPFNPTHKAVTFHFVDVFQFRDGKIAQATSYASNLEMLTQIGVGAPPAKPKKPAATGGGGGSPGSAAAKTPAKDGAPKPPANKPAAKPPATTPPAPPKPKP